MSVFQGLDEEYLSEAADRIRAVESILLSAEGASPAARDELLLKAKREMHTLKGNSSMMGFKDLQALAHRIEDILGTKEPGEGEIQACLEGLDLFRVLLKGRREGPSLPDARQQPEGMPRPEAEMDSLRVPFSSLDELVDLLAEMVIFRNRLEVSVGRGVMANRGGREWEDVSAAQEALSKTLGFIQERVMRLRMVPLQSLFGHLHRIVHDESRREGKRVRFEIRGGETPLDKALLEVCSEALGHVVRNAVIHGVEKPEEREAAGKDPEGRVLLDAVARGNEVWVTVEDDGRGIDSASLTAAAAERSIELGPGSDPLSLLFHAGFSTRSGVDLASGRGMGLSAALDSVQRAGGCVDVASRPGAGCRFQIKLPLSVSITRAMLCLVDGEEYAVPLAAIVESVRFQAGDGHRINHAGVMAWGSRVVPLLDMGHVYGTRQGLRERGYVVVIEADGKDRGLVVDDLTGIREIVVKGLDPMVGSPPGVSGSTILGDGRVILILDPRALAGLDPFLGGPWKASAPIGIRRET